MESSEPQSSRCIPAAIGLVFLAPLVAEFLLGNLPIKMLSALIVLAPFYGGGALLIRETTRRAGRGWPTVVLLALAYGIVEEAFTTQTLFNPNYMHLNLHLLDSAYIPALGISAWWTLFVLALHTVWSISVPIALIEATVPRHASTPWLGNWGLAVTAVLYVLGAAANTAIGFHTDHYIATPAQLATSAAIVILLAVVAFRLPAGQPTRPHPAPPKQSPVPGSSSPSPSPLAPPSFSFPSRGAGGPQPSSLALSSVSPRSSFSSAAAMAGGLRTNLHSPPERPSPTPGTPLLSRLSWVAPALTFASETPFLPSELCSSSFSPPASSAPPPKPPPRRHVECFLIGTARVSATRCPIHWD
jgi:hypothetical protein